MHDAYGATSPPRWRGSNQCKTSTQPQFLAADFLRTIVNKAWQMGVMQQPLSEDFGGDYPTVQYADDTLLILPAKARVLFNFKGLLSWTQGKLSKIFF